MTRIPEASDPYELRSSCLFGTAPTGLNRYPGVIKTIEQAQATVNAGQDKHMSVVRSDTMGKILTPLVVTNRWDQRSAKQGFIAQEQVRTVALTDVLVDTGATTLCLPAPIIEQLGLELLRAVEVETATGINQARIFQDAKISLLGREGTFECLELPGGRAPLLGVIPLEALGIELDLQRQQLVPLPISRTQTYLTIL